MVVDLHGYTEAEATGIILSSLMSLETYETQIEFIVGNGFVLGNLVFDLANIEMYTANYNGSNRGSIIVKK